MPLYAILAFALLAQAATQSAPRVPASPAPSTPLRAKASPLPMTSPAAPPTRTIVGEIVSIDVPQGLVVVARHGTAAHESTPAHAGESVTVALDGATKILKGKSPALLSDLRTKDRAVVRYQLTPKGARALSVRVADLLVRTPTPNASPDSPIPSSTPSAVTGGRVDK